MGQPRRYWKLTREGTINPQKVEQRAEAWATGATSGGSATVVVTRDEEGLGHYLVMDDVAGADTAALNLAHCVAARLEHVDEPPDLSGGRHVAQLWWRRSSASVRATQAGVDLAEVSRILGDVMPQGSWVAAVVRKPTMFERRWWSGWLAYRMGTRRPTHHSTVRGAVVTTLWAGGTGRADAKNLLQVLASSLPGFDLTTWTRRPSRVIPGLLMALVGALVVVGGVNSAAVAGFITGLGFAQVAALVGAHAGVLIGAGVALGALAVATWAGLVPVRAVRIRRGLARAWLPKARHRLTPPRKPNRVNTQELEAEEADDGGNYPLKWEAFMLGPHIPASIVAPHSGVLSGAASTRQRGVPLEMTRPLGPRLGTSGDDSPVFASYPDIGRGLAVLGEPGSGKSELLRNILAAYMRERVAPSGRDGFPGQANAVVSFETKLDGATQTLAWARAMGDKMALVEVANPDSYAIDLFAVPGTVVDKGLHFVNAMQYAFADGSIRDESFRTLRIVITAGLVVTDEMAAGVDGVATGGSPIYYASVLMGRLGDKAATSLAAKIEHAHEQAQADGLTGHEATLAWEGLALMFASGVTPAQRASLQRAPGNKIDQLLGLDHFFAPGRRRFSWQRVLTEHKGVVVLTGADSAGHMMEANMEQLMSSLLMFSLRHTIERTCAGWEKQGRWVSVFADEVRTLSGSSPDVITWLRDSGRSYGVRPHFATQYLDQLEQEVRRAMLTYPVLVGFKQNSGPVAEQLVEDFCGDGTEWAKSDVLNLPLHHAIVRANVGHRRQPPFSFASAYYIDPGTGLPDTARFLADQQLGEAAAEVAR